MCGITGYFGSQINPDINGMVEELKHRGPDSDGLYRDKQVGLGSRRLKIVGSEDGDQPVHNEEETIWTVFNGEIYNHESLRSKLQSKGHNFYTSTDTEVIVHAYEEWGMKCFEKFQGMYAVAIRDRENEKLLLARDPIGKKPVYYHNENGNLLFGSEIKSILSTDLYSAELNEKAVKHFLAYGYNQAPETLFSDIKKLYPGEILVVDRDGVKNRKVRNQFEPKDVPENLDKAADQLRSILKKNMKDWTREGGSYSVFLSGGIDSSAILALLSQMDDIGSLKAYTAAFPGSKFDETAKAEQIANHFGVEHEVVDISRNAVNMIPELVKQFDDLMADQACVPYYKLSDQASNHSPVGFTGSGSDELFGGYEHYTIMDLGDKYAKPFPETLRSLPPYLASKMPNQILNHFFPYVDELGPKGFERFSQYMRSVESLPEAYEQINAMMTDGEIDDLLEKSEKDKEKKLTEFPNNIISSDRTDMRQVMAYEQFYQLPNKNLMKADKTSMAHGLELRTPLLNQQTIEFSAGMSNNLLRGNGGKKVFKKAMRPFLPDKIRNQQKQRLLMPIHEWMKNESWWTIEELAARYGMPPILEELEIEKMINGLESSPLYYSRQLWNIAHFIVWYDKYIS